MNRAQKVATVAIALISVALVGFSVPSMLRQSLVAVPELADQIFQGNAPTATGQVPCATGAGAGTWQTPASCGLSTGTNYWTLSGADLDASAAQDWYNTIATDTLREIGWSGYPATAANVLRYRMGNANNGLQQGTGTKLQLYSGNGIVIQGGLSGGTLPPATITGGGASDTSLELIASASGGALKLSTTSTAGTAISFSGRVTNAPGTVVALQSCTDSAAVAMTGVTTGAECQAGTGGWTTQAITVQCYASTAGNIKFHFCNPTAANITTVATFSCRCMNP